MIPGVNLPALEPGTVWLVGAGPGDPGLLTLHAVNALAQADHVLCDSLVGPGILALVNPAAIIEHAGKRGWEPSISQEAITSRLIALARAGRRVVRLKGGDPFVFGRGGEEARALVQAGIRFAVVPGITASLAALSAAAIPATTRETNSALVLATGHFAHDAPERLDWAEIARLGQPIVLYMAMHNLGEIAAELMGAGLAPETPVIVVTSATTPAQRLVETTLGKAGDEVRAAGLKPPGIIAIGAIVRLREHLKNALIPLVEAETEIASAAPENVT